MITHEQLKPYSLMTGLSAAVFAGDLDIAKQLLNEALLGNYHDGVAAAVMHGKRIAKPEPLSPGKSYPLPCSDAMRAEFLGPPLLNPNRHYR